MKNSEIISLKKNSFIFLIFTYLLNYFVGCQADFLVEKFH